MQEQMLLPPQKQNDGQLRGCHLRVLWALVCTWAKTMLPLQHGLDASQQLLHKKFLLPIPHRPANFAVAKRASNRCQAVNTFRKRSQLWGAHSEPLGDVCLHLRQTFIPSAGS